MFGGLSWHLLRVLGPAPCPAPGTGDGASHAPVMLNRIHRLPGAGMDFISTFAFANTVPAGAWKQGGVTAGRGGGDVGAAGPGLRLRVQEGFRLCHASCL